MSKKIGIIAGSLRKESYSKKIAKNVLSMAPEGFEFSIISIDDLPVYNQDFDDEEIESYNSFRSTVNGVDGIIFITPEYNRSVPSALKNAIDVGSRPYGQSVWNNKPAAIFSLSIGTISGFGANHHLRQSLAFLNMPTMQQPEVYLANIGEALDENGNIVNEQVRSFLQQAVDAYTAWFKRTAE